jgi:hypothetical protein
VVIEEVKNNSYSFILIPINLYNKLLKMLNIFQDSKIHTHSITDHLMNNKIVYYPHIQSTTNSKDNSLIFHLIQVFLIQLFLSLHI